MNNPYYHDEKYGITIYHGDCRDILPDLEPVDLVLTDPQYGIGFDTTAKRSRLSTLDWASESKEIVHDPRWKPLQNGDTIPFDPTPLLQFKNVILFGANNFASRLPDTRGWIIWDKLGDKNSSAFGDCELIWTSFDASIRIHRQLWRGICREGRENVANESKCHPCQKPISLMKFCISYADAYLKKQVSEIIDPYMGSGSTLLAAKELGRKAIGIEIEEKYCEIAVRRLQQDCFQWNENERTQS